MKSEVQWGSHEAGGRAPHPRGSPDLVPLPIYTLIHWKHPGELRNHFSTTATFCTHEIPSRGLSRVLPEGDSVTEASTSTLLPFDEAWVVYHRPTGLSLVARWLLLSLWISVPCSPQCSWRSIWCNIILRFVCRDTMNCGYMIRLSMNIIWVFSEFLYAWFDIFASLFELSV